QHPRQPVRVLRPARRARERPGRRYPLRRLQPDERRLPPEPPRDGRRPARRQAAARAARPQPGLQLGAAHDPPSELPRAAAAASPLPAGGDLMDLAAEILVGLFVIAIAVFVAALFVWAAKKDGEEDKALQKRLGIRRRTRLGR